MLTQEELLKKKCAHAEQALDEAAINHYLALVPGWSLESGKLCKQYQFTNYYETLAFVNAIAFLLHAADHHPEMLITYNRCLLKFDTHSVNGGKGGISENDFICAAQIDAMARHAH